MIKKILGCSTACELYDSSGLMRTGRTVLVRWGSYWGVCVYTFDVMIWVSCPFGNTYVVPHSTLAGGGVPLPGMTPSQLAMASLPGASYRYLHSHIMHFLVGGNHSCCNWVARE